MDRSFRCLATALIVAGYYVPAFPRRRPGLAAKSVHTLRGVRRDQSHPDTQRNPSLASVALELCLQVPLALSFDGSFIHVR